jgi:iduronate 2-sulfatase
LDKGKTTRGYPYENATTDDMAYADGKTAQKAIQDLQKLKKGDKPFFLAVGFHKPHLPFNAPKKYWDLYDFNKIKLPANYSQPASTPKQAFHKSGELRNYSGVPKEGFVSDSLALKLLHGYYACVSYTDAQIGKVLDELKRLELDKNTIIVLIGDHGWNLGDHKMWNKHCNFASSLNTPLILKIPNKTSGQRFDNVVEFIDIFPTMAALAKLNLPNTTNGESLLPIIENKKRTKDFAISKWADGVTIIKGQLYYTEWLDKDDKPVAKMLFDHKTDPFELNNLAEKAEYAAVIADLSKQLHANKGADFNLDRRTERAKK